MVERFPLQAYASALVFSPTHCLTRTLFQGEEPDWVVRKPQIEEDWDTFFMIKQDRVNTVCLVFSPDGRHFAGGSADDTVRVWNTVDSECLLTLEGHSGVVFYLAFSPDGRYIASGSYDQTVNVWDAESGKGLLTLEGHSGTVWSVVFSPDGRSIASSSVDETVRVWNAEDGKCLLTLEGHTDTVWCVAFSPDGRHIASGSGDETIRVWGAESGECITTIQVGEAVSRLTFNPTSSHLHTKAGIFPYENSSDVAAFTPFGLTDPNRAGYGLSSDRCWITWRGQNVLWLPLEFQPRCADIFQETVCIGCPYRRPSSIQFSLDKQPIPSSLLY